MREQIGLPEFSMEERNRRWGGAHALMREKGFDCIVLCGMPYKWDSFVGNARFLSQIGGNGEHVFLVFPLEGEPTAFVALPTFIPYWKSTQKWVKDVRAKKGPWADNVAVRLGELGLGKGRVGFDGLSGPLEVDGWLPHSVYNRLKELLPDLEIVNTDDMLERMRAVKGTEEIEFLENAAALGDIMLQTCRETARPGVRESDLYGGMMEAMIANGGEVPTLFLFSADAHPFPHPFRFPTKRPMERGDLIICEMHPKYGGYCTHVERTFCLGEPAPEYRRIYENGILRAYQHGLDGFGPGVSMVEVMDGVRRIIEEGGFAVCEVGIHGHGLASQEYPRYRHHLKVADVNIFNSMGKELEPGMVFAFNIDLIDPGWRNGETGCVFAETILITDDGCRRMHSFPTEFQVIEV